MSTSPVELAKMVPPPLLYILLIVGAVGTIWPAMKDVWFGVVPWERRYKRRLEQLTLLKLQTEIEILRKSNGLSDLPPFSTQYLANPFQINDAPPNVGSSKNSMRAWDAFMLGWLGGICIPLLRLAYDTAATRYFYTLSPSFWLGVVLMGIVGGTASLMQPRRRATKVSSAFAGLFGTMAITILVRCLT